MNLGLLLFLFLNTVNFFDIHMYPLVSSTKGLEWIFFFFVLLFEKIV